jgi:hypothetical protein
VWATAASAGIPLIGITSVWVDWRLCWLATWTVAGCCAGRLFASGASFRKQWMFAPESSIVYGGEGPSVEFNKLTGRLIKLLWGVLGVPLGQEALGGLGFMFSWFPRPVRWKPLVLPPILLLAVALAWWPSCGERQSLLACAQDP